MNEADCDELDRLTAENTARVEERAANGVDSGGIAEGYFGLLQQTYYERALGPDIVAGVKLQHQRQLRDALDKSEPQYDQLRRMGKGLELPPGANLAPLFGGNHGR